MAERSPGERMMEEWARWVGQLSVRQDGSVVDPASGKVDVAPRDPQQGPLEGPYGPSGTAGVSVTASGRDPGVAASEGPVRVPGPRGGGSASSPGVSRSERSVEEGGSRVGMMEVTPEVLEEVARLLLRQVQPSIGAEPPPLVEAVRREAGRQPPQGQTREQGPTWDAAHALIRLLEEAPELVRQALTSKSPEARRARATVLQRLDAARLWLREALEVEEREYQDRTVG